MNPLTRLAVVLFALLSLAGKPNTAYDERCLLEINAARADANARELAIHGEILAVREPLALAPELTNAANLWCGLLKGTDIFAHSALVQELSDANLATRVDADRNGVVTISERQAFCGWMGIGSENGSLSKSASDPAWAVASWCHSGWSDDPRKATLHYSNVVSSKWTHFGAAWGTGFAGRKRAFGEFGAR